MPGVETDSRPKEHRPSIVELNDQLIVSYDSLAKHGVIVSFDQILREAYRGKRGPERRAIKQGKISDREFKQALLRQQPEILTMPSEQLIQLSFDSTIFVSTLNTVREAHDGNFKIPDDLKRPPRIRKEPTHKQAPLF